MQVVLNSKMCKSGFEEPNSGYYCFFIAKVPEKVVSNVNVKYRNHLTFLNCTDNSVHSRRYCARVFIELPTICVVFQLPLNVNFECYHSNTIKAGVIPQ